jgi:hypothetical protein
MNEPLLIGWKEYLDLPEWGLRRVRVKIDTGARTTALGVQACELRSTNTGTLARLTLALHRRRPTEQVVIETPVLRMVRVRNTSGRWETRPLIETEMRLGRCVQRVRMTVANRQRMLFPIILGRQALAGAFLVDVSQAFVQKRPAYSVLPPE